MNIKSITAAIVLMSFCSVATCKEAYCMQKEVEKTWWSEFAEKASWVFSLGLSDRLVEIERTLFSMSARADSNCERSDNSASSTK